MYEKEIGKCPCGEKRELEKGRGREKSHKASRKEVCKKGFIA